MEKMENIDLDKANITPGLFCYKISNQPESSINLETLINASQMPRLVEEAKKNDGIIACDHPNSWKKIFPDCPFIHYRDTIHHVFNRPIYIYGLNQYLNSICKDIIGYTMNFYGGTEWDK